MESNAPDLSTLYRHAEALAVKAQEVYRLSQAIQRAVRDLATQIETQTTTIQEPVNNVG